MSRTRTPELSWAREEDEEWADAVLVRLVLDEDAPSGFADEMLVEAHQLVAEAGQPAAEVLGDPAAYARTVASERVSERYRARIDTRGMRPGERVAASFGTLGFLLFAVFGLYWIQDGLWVTVAPSSLAGFAGIAVGSCLGCLAFVARSAGLLRGMWGFLAGAAAALIGGIALASTLAEDRLFRVPAPVLMLAGVGWAVGAFLLPDTRIDRWFAPGRRAGGTEGGLEGSREGGLDDERWLARLEGLLRGRHGMKAAEARGHVREARQHLASAEGSAAGSTTGSTTGSAAGEERAEDVFGDVEIYALRLSEGPRRQQRVTRQKLYGALTSAVVFAVLGADRLIDPEGRSMGWVAVYVGAFGCAAWTAFGEWRSLRKQRAAGASGGSGVERGA
ncbi:hypothetical protein AB0C93_23640 [Streptomyces sp. NPDC048518]|uniref:hypothetical protein n=1 Tax=Streptomyces sp. NPDC048518 TaxID=3155029 RepID=UPI0033E98F7F